MAVDIPNYRVIEKLGVGAQSRIYRARCMRTGGDYSIKIVKIIKPEDAGFVDLLRTEHAIGTAIDHPAVRKIFEFRLLRHRLRVRGAILFMEYVDGISMSGKSFNRSLDDILRFAMVAAEGLHAMHVGGFVHADLKPNNIMVTSDDGVKLIDLGQSAKIHEAKPRVQGTIDYMAPEQVQRASLDQRTDVFGLGATLHKVLTGKAITTQMNQTVNMASQSLVGRRVSEIQQEPTQELPACVRRLLEDCCQTDPADRIQDMNAFIERAKMARTVLAKQAAGGPAVDAYADAPDERPDDDEFPDDPAPESSK